MIAASGDWLDALPGPLVLLLCVALAAMLVWFVATRDPERMRRELRDGVVHPRTGQALAKLPAPILRTVILVLASGIAAYGIGRVM